MKLCHIRLFYGYVIVVLAIISTNNEAAAEKPGVCLPWQKRPCLVDARSVPVCRNDDDCDELLKCCSLDTCGPRCVPAASESELCALHHCPQCFNCVVSREQTRSNGRRRRQQPRCIRDPNCVATTQTPKPPQTCEQLRCEEQRAGCVCVVASEESGAVCQPENPVAQYSCT